MNLHANEEDRKPLLSATANICRLRQPWDTQIDLSTNDSNKRILQPSAWHLRLRNAACTIVVAVGMVTIGLIYFQHVSVAPRASSTTPFSADFTPRHAELTQLASRLQPLQVIPIRRAQNGLLKTSLHINITHFTNGPISFYTRSYEGSIPGPLLSVVPGDIMQFEIINELGPNTLDPIVPNTYHSPNTTNLHVHGMHVDPTGTADNVFRVLLPGESMKSNISIPHNHPRGLFHYHPHAHGSVFLQMGGGMVGPVVVEDDVNHIPSDYHPDVMPRHVLVLQEFRFDGGMAASLSAAAAASRSTLDMKLELTPSIYLYDQVCALFPHLASCANNNHGSPFNVPQAIQHHYHQLNRSVPSITRFMTVNGQYLPKIIVHEKENTMLRLLNAGSSSIVELSIPDCTMQLIASDGIYLGDRLRTIKVLVLSPGARADVVIHCVSSHTSDVLRPLYSVPDASFNRFVGGASDVFTGILALIQVMPALSKHISTFPLTTTPPPPVLYGPQADLRVLSDHDINRMAPSPYQFEFTMTHTSTIKNGFYYKDYLINHRLFDPASLHHHIPLNVVQEWIIINAKDEANHPTYKNHPFHLHTNAFQIIDIQYDDPPHEQGIIDYAIGDWRDVILIPTPGNVTIRFRPMDFQGRIVAHCHILGHSDAGMIELVEIV